MNKNFLSAVNEYKEISKEHEQLGNLTLFSLHQLAAALWAHLQVFSKELTCSVKSKVFDDFLMHFHTHLKDFHRGYEAYLFSQLFRLSGKHLLSVLRSACQYSELSIVSCLVSCKNSMNFTRK